MAPKSIKKCIALRETAITQMNELKKVAEVADRQEALYESSYPEFKARYKFIERIYGDFYQYHNTIIGTLANSDEELNQEKEIQAAFDNDYYYVHMVFERVFKSKPTFERSQSNQSETTNKDHIQLPRLELYKFSGELKTWKTFLDMFNSTIHKNGSLSDVEKFSYLISSLSEEPLSIVSRIPMVGTNYQIAYDALVKRYDNKRLLATHYWNQIENVPSLTENYTSSQLRTLLSTFEENLAALKMLQFPVESWDFVLFNMLLNRLCSSLVSRFELGQDSPTAVPTFKSLSEFLLLMSQASDNVSQNVTPNTSKLTQKVPKIVSSPVKPRQGSVFLVNSENSKCALCNRDYLIYKCPTFLAKSPQSRYEIVKSKQWCLNCLGAKHLLRNCNSSSTCRDCHQRHHSLLHFVSSNTLSTQSKPATISENPIAPIDTSPKSLDSPTRINSLTNLIPSQSVLLSTAVVEVQDSLGQFQEVRILLDSASQANFITKNCAERLGLSRKTSTFIIKGLGGMNDKASKEVSCTLRSKNEPSIRFSINAILFDKICDDMPSVSFSTSGWTNLMNLTLADSQFNLSRGIDMLLGADIFPLILESGRLLGNSDVPTAMNTKFGWILMGQFRSNTHRKHSSSPHLHSFCATIESFETIPLENIVKQFWEIEEPNLPLDATLPPEDTLAKNNFASLFYRNNSGRFVVPMLFKEDDPIFPGSFANAFRRLQSIERRLIKNPLLYEDYKAFMNEYLDLGHMQLLTNGNSSDGYYIPHHCVIKADSPSTKLRVVFDASCPSSF
nr:PREDICTED: uncharacterized protein LOC107398928 [Tribolium castaneum]|eukprot:XP_015839988.1 PREDICTED: uncharacterized protein LOC107398928 [Tribolium castaneum]